MESHSSDKNYWHRFTETYAKVFDRIGPVSKVLEIGILRGDSIRWLRETFPSAQIFAADIMPVQQSWPKDSKIKYLQCDQGKDIDVREMLRHIGDNIDLIVEDGSHVPQHQARCLSLCFPQLRRGGVYILEDIHTSHPSSSFSLNEDGDSANALKLLLAVKHLKELKRPICEATIAALSSDKFFSHHDVEKLINKIHDVEIFKRASLPLMCWACNGLDFDYIKLKCKCGTDLYAEADSMTAVIVRS